MFWLQVFEDLHTYMRSLGRLMELNIGVLYPGLMACACLVSFHSFMHVASLCVIYLLERRSNAKKMTLNIRIIKIIDLEIK